jgi:hypothetical protein
MTLETSSNHIALQLGVPVWGRDSRVGVRGRGSSNVAGC